MIWLAPWVAEQDKSNPSMIQILRWFLVATTHSTIGFIDLLIITIYSHFHGKFHEENYLSLFALSSTPDRLVTNWNLLIQEFVVDSNKNKNKNNLISDHGYLSTNHLIVSAHNIWTSEIN